MLLSTDEEGCILVIISSVVDVYLTGLCIPSNNTIFIKSVSERLAANEPHLTLEFLEECIQGFRASNIEMKHLCLEYMTPWLPNLTRSELCCIECCHLACVALPRFISVIQTLNSFSLNVGHRLFNIARMVGIRAAAESLQNTQSSYLLGPGV